MFDVRFSRQAQKQVLELPPAHRKRLKTIIEKLRESPFDYPYQKVQGRPSHYRIRVGDYRIIFKVFSEDYDIWIKKIAKRSQAYK